MEQDIKKLLENYDTIDAGMPKGHEARFASRLDEAFPQQKKSISMWIQIAAVVIVALGIAFFGYQSVDQKPVQNTLVQTDTTPSTDQITLGDISPDLKKIEEFYTTGINVQLASLKITSDNKEVIDGFLSRLNQLNEEYTVLNQELNQVGPTEETITALIDNLKLRLDLLFKLKNKLKELKNQENEQFSSNQA